MPLRPYIPPELRASCNVFLRELRRTANAKASAEAAGVTMSSMLRRLLRYPVFATRWDAALAFARAALARGGPVRAEGTTHKTLGGEYVVSQGLKRLPQVRRAHPGQVTAEGERAFLASLAATANVSLSCETVGISKFYVYHRCERDERFADAMGAALEHGYQRLELELLESATASLDPSQLVDWMDETVELPSPLLRMSYDQVINMLGLHHKRVRLGERRRPHNRKEPTAEDTDRTITGLLDRLNRRAEQERAREERAAARGEGKG